MTLAIITQSGILEQAYKAGDKQLATLKVGEISILLSFYKVEENILNAMIGQQVAVSGKLYSKNNCYEIDVDTIGISDVELSLITFVGRSGREINTKVFDSGKSVAKGSVAVNQFGRQDTSWFNFEAWNKKSEVLANYVSKGAVFGGYGSIKIDKYKNKDGKEVISPVVALKDVYLFPKAVSQASNSEPVASTISNSMSSEDILF